MEIVIDIPNRIYKIIQNKTLNIMDAEILEKAVKNGIPLDKIRAETADLDDADYDYEGYYKAVTDAVKIIDKYRDKEQGE